MCLHWGTYPLSSSDQSRLSECSPEPVSKVVMETCPEGWQYNRDVCAVGRVKVPTGSLTSLLCTFGKKYVWLVTPGSILCDRISAESMKL